MSTQLFLFIALTVLVGSGASALRTEDTHTATLPLTKKSFVDWLCQQNGDSLAQKTACLSSVGVESVKDTATRVVDRIIGSGATGVSGLEEMLAGLSHQSAPLQSFLSARKGKTLLSGVWARIKAAWGGAASKREYATNYLVSLREDLVSHATANGLTTTSTAIPFEILPQYLGGLDVMSTSQQNQSFTTKCFPTFFISTSLDTTSRKLAVTVSLPAGSTAGCSAQLMFFPGNADLGFEIYEGTAVPQTKTLSLDVSSIYSGDAADMWYFQSRGLQVFELRTSNIFESVASLIDTVVLLIGFAIKAPSGAIFDASYNFVRDYVQADSARMGKATLRTAGNVVARNLDPSTIKSGDLIMLLRPDGLDPMIGWGEGSLAGHSTIAMYPPNQGLHICESTTKDAYWPNNGIQCTPWSQWLDQCEASLQNVVHVPLKPEYLGKFNVSAALAFFEAHKGVDYGYQSFLFGWVDTAGANFPCTPVSNYTVCMDPPLVEKIALLFDSVFGSNHENFFRQALAHRVGLWSPANSPNVVGSMYHGATVLNKDFTDVYQIPEQDSWKYNTTQNGVSVLSKSMVCCVFVCNMWKAAGIFSEIGDQLQCGEQTLWDIYSMALFDENKMGENRPQVCKDADPSNPLCQIMGNITMVLAPDLNSRSLYPNMGEKCSSVCPAYRRASGC